MSEEAEESSDGQAEGRERRGEREGEVQGEELSEDCEEVDVELGGSGRGNRGVRVRVDVQEEREAQEVL